ncbi:MAG: hypothetical protein RMJ98_02690 [Myxococcales bacterium]|nr:hypothetical protein [Polyangiaceae bacterium]MDW8248197.1 hypothetical protein [Myxococcales bacterium]
MQIMWSSGRKGSVVEVQGEKVILRSDVALAPGTPTTFSLEASGGEVFQVKVHSCRREGTGFVLTGRLINLTREQRTLLEGGKLGDAAS